ncbi:MAG: hypothetical protein JAY72_21190 [Candidatus Thiodiazotropha endolucinida]|nr:hypothetical protein [Candidatus Thiodiazotropha taylori]MCW4324199.1 hypothetical protein [Candidatus Thiodiazotropha taylori]
MSSENIVNMQVEFLGDSPKKLEINEGESINIVESEASIKIVSVEEGLAFGDTTLYEIALTFGSGVATGIIANALTAILGKGVRRMVLNGRRVRPTERDVERALDVIREAAMCADKEKDK